jgi:hypothetical protein
MGGFNILKKGIGQKQGTVIRNARKNKLRKGKQVIPGSKV